jgi:hypothetical protein
VRGLADVHERATGAFAERAAGRSIEQDYRDVRSSQHS